MPPKKQLVLAGNYDQFRVWCHESMKRAGVDAHYLRDEMSVRGVNYSDVELVLYGTYTSHKLWGSPHLQYLMGEISRAAAQEALAVVNAFLKKQRERESRMAKNRWESLLV
jgi:hypothetical protein